MLSVKCDCELAIMGELGFSTSLIYESVRGAPCSDNCTGSRTVTSTFGTGGGVIDMIRVESGLWKKILASVFRDSDLLVYCFSWLLLDFSKI